MACVITRSNWPKVIHCSLHNTHNLVTAGKELLSTLLIFLGGYAFMEGKGKSSVSRLFSPPFPGNATHCLSFFFTMAYNSPNSTLTVYRLVVKKRISQFIFDL
jgi:hypothetical protein